MKDHSAVAELISLGALVALTVILLVIRRTVALTTTDGSYTDRSGVQVKFTAGSVIASTDTSLLLPQDYTIKHLPLLRYLIVGKDNRVSTSKSVVFAWTYAVIFGLLALIVAKWLGTPAGYNSLINHGLQDEYLLFLGGPLAAGVLAKYKATSDAQGQNGRSAAPVGSASPSQLIADDSGETDIGDLQYVLFNVLALIYYLGTFVPHLSDGMPDLPQLLTGLALTSAAGYSAKQLVAQAAPVLNSLHPPAAPPTVSTATSSIQIWGRNLIVPASASSTTSALPPIVSIGGYTAVVTGTSQPMGVDNITVTVPEELTTVGSVKVIAIRADGVTATGPGGTDGLTLAITAPPA
jgi:hypothetical protein